MALTKQQKEKIGAFFRSDDPDPTERYKGKSDLEVFDIWTQNHEVEIESETDDSYVIKLTWVNPDDEDDRMPQQLTVPK